MYRPPAYNNWKCIYCGKIFRTRREKQKHYKEDHNGITQHAWNKGLTKETHKSLKKAGETYKKHLKEGKIVIYQAGKPIEEEVKKKISTSMIKAHKEGRAWNIGKSRWNNKPSYPEEFFIKVIKNEFFDKEYIREYPFGIYSLDFAWPNKKKCIEIDGQQHERFEDYKRRDLKKDECLRKEGWEILRIKWTDMFNNTKFWINEANQFIGM